MIIVGIHEILDCDKRELIRIGMDWSPHNSRQFCLRSDRTLDEPVELLRWNNSQAQRWT